MNRAFIFPGQGAQTISMGKEFYDNFSIAKETFNYVDDCLGRKLSDTIFYGPYDTLTMTINAQPALMVVSIAIFNVIKHETNKKIESLSRYVAGHSLGEYSALCVAESISLLDTVNLLRVRSQSMSEAYVGDACMAACLGISIAEIEMILSEIKETGICEIANDNLLGQIVVSGETIAVNHLISILKDLGYKSIKLKVSGPFHSSLMKDAELKISKILEKIKINTPKIPVIQNFTALPSSNTSLIKDNLIKQISGRVRWREILDFLEYSKISEVIEIGAGKTLTNMSLKGGYKFNSINISSIKDFDFFLKNH